MECAACGRAIAAGFPGATVTCACGHANVLPSLARPSSPEATPYRTAGFAPAETHDPPCPYCGNACPPLVRICPHCEVRLESVRCTRCFALQPPGSFVCARCTQALELEALLDATDAPCPRCSHPLETASGGDGRIHECPRCGGLFVAREVLSDLLCRAETSGALPPDAAGAPRSPALDEVRYLPCPLCHGTMNRVNFGRMSGVIVDVCKPHGTWFDAGELTRVIAFAAAGGLGKARDREEEEKQAQRAKSSEVRAALAALDVEEHAGSRLRAWEEFLRAIFFW